MEPRTIAPSSNVALVHTAPRVTPTPPRAAKFGEVLANTAVRTAEGAMRMLPGSPMMALAVRGGAAGVPLGRSSAALTVGAGAGAGAGKAPEGPAVTGAGSGIGGTGIGGSGVGGAGLGSPVDAGGGIESSLAQSQEMNLYMLGVQQQVQQQNQQFTTLSNVMKAQHDTVKTAIGNIR